MVALPALASIPHPEIDTLVAGALAGDMACFDALYRRDADRVYNLVLRSCGDRAEAEDVCQEVWTRAHRSLRQLRDAGAFDTWVLRIATRACIDAARRRHADYDETKLATLSDGHDLSEAVEERELRRLAWQALATLPQRQRLSLYLREVDGMRYAAIAEAIDATPAAVETLLFRARHSLAQAYGRLANSPGERCQRARHLMAVVLDGEGDAAEQRSLRAHLGDCHACQRQMFALRHGNRNYAALPIVGVASSVAPVLLPAIGGGMAVSGALIGLGRLGALMTKAAAASLPAVAVTVTVAVAAVASEPAEVLPGESTWTLTTASAGTSPSPGAYPNGRSLVPSTPIGLVPQSPAVPSVDEAKASLPSPPAVSGPSVAVSVDLKVEVMAPPPAIDVPPPAPPAELELSRVLPAVPPALPVAPILSALPQTPAVTLPQVTTPAVTVPQVTTPAVSVPSVTVPSMTTPSVTLPPVTSPPVTLSAVQVPPVFVPPVTVPSLNTPPLMVSPVTVLPLTIPSVTVPPVTVPAVTVPPVTVPSVSVPPVTVPPVTLPHIAVPSATQPSLPGGLGLPLGR